MAGVLSPGKQYTRHQSRKQLLRNLRHVSAEFLKSEDMGVQAARTACWNMCTNENDPRYTFLHLMAEATVAKDETGEPWPKCMMHILKGFRGLQEVNPEDNPAAVASLLAR